VREALRYDFAPWDNDFRPLYAGIRERVLRIAHGIQGEHATLPLQGCGHFITEAAIRTFIPPAGKLLIPATGSYADRMIRLAREAGRVPVPLAISPVTPTDPDAVAAALAADPGISHVGLVYSETGSGVVHDVAAVGCGASPRPSLIVDAVSAFGALPLDLSAQPEVDVVGFTSSAWKACQQRCRCPSAASRRARAMPTGRSIIQHHARPCAAAGQLQFTRARVLVFNAHSTCSTPKAAAGTPGATPRICAHSTTGSAASA
jgi:aspartate aminotransferase-like enzyme